MWALASFDGPAGIKKPIHRYAARRESGQASSAHAIAMQLFS